MMEKFVARVATQMENWISLLFHNFSMAFCKIPKFVIHKFLSMQRKILRQYNGHGQKYLELDKYLENNFFSLTFQEHCLKKTLKM